MQRSHDHGGGHQHVQLQPSSHEDSLPGGLVVSAKGLTLEPLMTRFEAGVIAFHAQFPTAGQYGLFLQFAHAGAVQTVDFETRVEYS